MSNAYFIPPLAYNEPILDYEPGSPEYKALHTVLKKLKSEEKDLPMYIGGREVYTGEKVKIHPPHELSHTLGTFSKGDGDHVIQAINAAVEARQQWEEMPWNERASIFLKAAELIAGPYRSEMNARTMLGQSKNIFQAEIDAVCEMADFFRFNVQYMAEIYEQQPDNAIGIWNRLEFRGLEGFIFALTPFNFTSIAANLPAAPALMGNTVVWKPAETQIYSADLIMRIFREAGLPDGVINLVYVDGPTAGDRIFSHRDFAGLHFTGSTGVFRKLWKNIADNLPVYRNYPRIVGETGGKDFVIAHPTADAEQVAVALSRGAFEFQGQKCSAASRAYLPESLWPQIRERLTEDLSSFKVGSPEDLKNFINAVIDRKAFEKITGYIKDVKENSDAEIIAGGEFNDEKGFFIDPTVILTTNPEYRTMCEEIFGPVLTIYIYKDEDYKETLHLLDRTSPYALTGAIFSKDRNAIMQATDILRHAAGNFYINDKPTGAVVNQQPFGGARASGTNDKAGSVLNLYRWVSARTIKENFNPPRNYRYPFMGQ